MHSAHKTCLQLDSNALVDYQLASFDIVSDILSRLPAKSLLRFRCVCKAWKSIIDDPFFVKSHTKNHRSSSASLLIRNRHGGALHCLPLDSLKYTGWELGLDVKPLKQIIHRGVPRLSGLPSPSCNGLILITHYNIKKSWAIWNPLLQDFHLLPPPPPPETDLKGKYGCDLARCGFGYDERSDDYKVVRVDTFYGKGVEHHYRTRVYSLKSRTWKTIDFPGGDCIGDIGAFLDGALHWRSCDGVVALDLGGEVHRLVAGPPPRPSGGRCWESLDALDGCLIWSYGYQNLNLKGMEAWVMEGYGTEKSTTSWTKLFSLETDAIDARCLRIVAYLKRKGQVLLQNEKRVLKWLDLDKNKCGTEFTISTFYHALSPDQHSRSLSFAQFSPASLVRLDNHKNRQGDREGGKRKRKWEKAYVHYSDHFLYKRHGIE